MESLLNTETHAELQGVIRDELLKAYDEPTINTIPPAEYSNRPIRYHLDNLISSLDAAHSAYLTTMKPETVDPTSPPSDIISKRLRNFATVCKSAKDEVIMSMFYTYCVEGSPRIAWWAVSSTDWIGQIPPSTISFSMWAKGSKTSPSLPIGIVYGEAMELRTRSESDPDVLAPSDSILAAKIALHFYNLMRVSTMLIRGQPTPADEARIKQCQRKLTVLKSSLEVAVDEEDDFLDVLLSMVRSNITGPDGEEVSIKTLRKGLGSALNTSIFHDIIRSIPAAMAGSNDAESAKASLLNQPAIKKLLNGGAETESIDQVFSLVMGSMGEGEGAGSSSAAPKKIRKSVNK